MLYTILFASGSLYIIAGFVHIFWPYALIMISDFDKDHRDTLLRFTRRVSIAITYVGGVISVVAMFTIEDSPALGYSLSIYFLVAALVYLRIAYLTVRFIKNEEKLGAGNVTVRIE